MSVPQDAIDGIVHEPTQVHEDGGVDLTVAEIYRIEGRGRVDFGGGELEDVSLATHDRVWRNEDDDHQWWHLDAGTWLLGFNESLATEARLILQPREAIVQRGASHPTLRVSSLPRVPLTVGGVGIRIKENARVSTVYPA